MCCDTAVNSNATAHGGAVEKYRQIERSIITTYRKSVWRKFIKGINTYKMINEGDSVAVCVSGGKNSALLAKCVQEIHRHGVVKFDVKYIFLQPAGSDKSTAKIDELAKLMNIPLHIAVSSEKKEDNTIINEKYMRLCDEAARLGCNKLALGHNFDSVIESVMMYMLYEGKIKAIMPKLRIPDMRDMEIIRPMYMVKEKNIEAWANHNGLEFCTDISDDCDDGRRAEVKALIKQFRRTSPYIDMNIFNSVQNVNLTTVIGYYDNDTRYSFLDRYDT